MNTLCPFCRSAIAIEDINVATDVALCRSCARTCRFSMLVQGSLPVPLEINSLPAGTWNEQLPDGFRVGASTRSWMALFLIPFTCVWSGMSLSGIYGSQFTKGQFDLMSSLLGIPFVIGTCWLISGCVMCLFGKVEITRSGDRLSIFIGVGALGWTRHYAWSDFCAVREDFASNSWRSRNRNQRAIVLEGRTRASFGTMLPEERRYFVLQALRGYFGDTSALGGITYFAPSKGGLY